MKVVIKDYIVRLNRWNRHFVIVQNEDGYYCAIEDKYIDENGCLTEGLNGFQMHASKKLNMCPSQTKAACRIDAMREDGLSTEEIWDKITKEFIEEVGKHGMEV